jgi:glycosyl transferase family 25
MNAFYINLDRRTDRRIEFENECQKIGISVERFPAIERTPGTLGCTQSHLEVLKLARQRNYPSVILFEDDFVFLVSKEEWNECMTKLPIEYDVIMLSYNLILGIPYNETFGKVLEAQNASGYIVHSRFYDTLIQTLEQGLAMFEKTPNEHWIYINDQYWKRLQPSATWLYSLQRIGKQRPGYSDLTGQFMDYGT